MNYSAIILVLVGVAALLAVRSMLESVTVYEFERGLKYTRGRFRGVLEPGKYWETAALRNLAPEG